MTVVVRGPGLGAPGAKMSLESVPTRGPGQGKERSSRRLTLSESNLSIPPLVGQHVQMRSFIRNPKCRVPVRRGAPLPQSASPRPLTLLPSICWTKLRS